MDVNKTSRTYVKGWVLTIGRVTGLSLPHGHRISFSSLCPLSSSGWGDIFFLVVVVLLSSFVGVVLPVVGFSVSLCVSSGFGVSGFSTSCMLNFVCSVIFSPIVL